MRSIAVHKLPERLELVKEFPLTKISKIDKKELRRIITGKVGVRYYILIFPAGQSVTVTTAPEATKTSPQAGFTSS